MESVAAVASEISPEQKRLENELAPLEFSVFKTRISLDRYNEDLALGKVKAPDEKLRRQIMDLVEMITPTYDPNAETGDAADELFESVRGSPSWWTKLGIAAQAFNVDRTCQTGTEEEPTAYDALMEVSDSLTSLISDESDQNPEKILALRDKLAKLDYAVGAYPKHLHVR